jgi:hypothetical protein
MRGPKAPGKVRKTEVMMVVVTEPFLGPRRVDRLLEPLDTAGDDDGAFVCVPVLVPRLPEQLQDQGVAEQRHRHREPPRRLAVLPSSWSRFIDRSLSSWFLLAVERGGEPPMTRLRDRSIDGRSPLFSSGLSLWCSGRWIYIVVGQALNW